MKKGLLRAVSVCLCFMLLLFPLSGCRSQMKGSNTSNQSTAEPSDGASDTEKQNIVFMGNSLTFVSQVPGQFKKIAKSQNVTVKVTDLSESSYTLAMHADDVKKSEYLQTTLQNADVVIFQEYGGTVNNTAESLKTLISYVSTKAKLYVLLTEFDVEVSMEKALEGIPDITFIPSGYVHNNLLESGYEYQQLHKPNDYHPNELYGYIAALTVYSVVYNKPVNNIPDQLSSEGKENAYKPGDPNASAEDCLKEIKQVITDTITEYQKNADMN